MTAAELAALHRRRAAKVPIEFRKSMRGWAISAVAFTRQMLTDQVYAIPEDLTTAGKTRQAQGKRIRRADKKWTRTGALRRGERWELIDDYSVRIVNDMIYAVRRERASASADRSKKAKGEVHYINPARESHWREELVKLWESVKGEIWAATMRDILKG